MPLQPPPPPPTPAADLACIVHLTPEHLATLLQLPEGAVIDYVQQRIDEPGTLQLRIRGAGHRVAHGAVIPRVRPIVTRHVTKDADGAEVTRHTIDWQWPSREREEAEIRALGQRHDEPTLAEQCIQAGGSLEGARCLLLQELQRKANDRLRLYQGYGEPLARLTEDGFDAR